jgi:hypothetical protein
MTGDNKELIDDIIFTFDRLKQERTKHEKDWNEVQEYVASVIVNFTNPDDEQIPKRPRRYTSRPTHYLKALVSGVSGYSISPSIAWLKLSLEQKELLDYYLVKDWLESVERLLYAEFNHSNLYAQIPRLIEYSATFGHGAMLVDEDIRNNRLRFSTIAITELFFDINEYEEVETVYRYFRMTLKNAASFFGLDNLPEKLQTDYEDKKKWAQEVKIIHAVYRRQEYDDEQKDNKNMPFASIYIDEGSRHLLQESGYKDNPYAVFLWDHVHHTAYGSSPSYYALDDIKLLNKTEEARIQVAQLSAQPPMNVPSVMRGQESVVPRGYNYYETPDQIMKPIETGTNFPITIEITKSIEERVRDWFHVDFFLMLQNDQRRQQMTATEVMELQGEKAAVLSDLVVNLNGALNRIVQRSFNILMTQRKIPEPPSVLAGSGANLKIEFIGPLAQAQKKYHEHTGIMQGIQLIGTVLQIPSAMAAADMIDFDKLIKTGLEGLGVPQNVIREDDDVVKIRQARQQQQAQMQQQAAQAEQQKNVLGNIDKLNQPVNPDSMLQGMGEAMAGAKQ